MGRARRVSREAGSLGRVGPRCLHAVRRFDGQQQSLVAGTCTKAPTPYVPAHIPGVHISASMAARFKKQEVGEAGEVEEHPKA